MREPMTIYQTLCDRRIAGTIAATIAAIPSPEQRAIAPATTSNLDGGMVYPRSWEQSVIGSTRRTTARDRSFNHQRISGTCLFDAKSQSNYFRQQNSPATLRYR